MNTPHPVWIIIPVHNRRETTRACLTQLATLGLPDECLICVVDDGCTDGTREMLISEFPHVHVVTGNGHLYWGGGVGLGMEHARNANAEIIVWLNDDCQPATGSIQHLIDRVRQTKGISGGICYDPDDKKKLTYSGAADGKIISEFGRDSSEPIAAESLNGNLVAIHRDALEKLGPMPSHLYPHFGGDIIYTLRAHRMGLPVEVAPLAKALNRRDDPLQKVMRSGSVIRLWREMGRIPSPLYYPTYWNLLKERFGWRAWYRWPAFYLRMLRLSLQVLKRPNC